MYIKIYSWNGISFRYIPIIFLSSDPSIQILVMSHGLRKYIKLRNILQIATVS